MSLYVFAFSIDLLEDSIAISGAAAIV